LRRPTSLVAPTPETSTPEQENTPAMMEEDKPI